MGDGYFSNDQLLFTNHQIGNIELQTNILLDVKIDFTIIIVKIKSDSIGSVNIDRTKICNSSPL